MESKLSIERRPDVERRCGWATSTLYERIKQGLFPAPLKLSRRSVGWLAHETDAVLRARMRGVDDAGIKLLVSDLIAARNADVTADAAAIEG